MLRNIRQKLGARYRQWFVDRFVEQRERHGIALSMYIENAPLETGELWPKLEAALDLIAEHSPTWIRRIRRVRNTVHVRRIPGTRARLAPGQFTLLDPYLLANFLPAQIASSIVHEGVHATMRFHEVPRTPDSPAREERACRRAELRFGLALQRAGVAGAEAVVQRATMALALPDDDVGVVVDHEALRVIGVVARIKDLPGPLWFKRFVGKRQRVVGTAQWKEAFGE
jgi:hypothetical protein